MRTRFVELTYNSPAYRKVLALRHAVLRRPLGQVFTEEQLYPDAHSRHVGLFCNERPVACAVLTPITDGSGGVKLRQFAVAPAYQGQGLGKELLQHTEVMARQAGFTTMVLHARCTASGFYARAGYKQVGAEFDEVGLPHVAMQKALKGV